MAFRSSKTAFGALRSAVPTLKGRPLPRSRAAPYIAGLTILSGTIWIFAQGHDDLFSLSKVRERFMVYNDSAVGADRIVDSRGQNAAFRVDPDTSIEFPSSLVLTTPTPALSLVGLGVRKVSFLRVKVYSVGFYLEDSALKSLSTVPGFSSFTAEHLMIAPTPSSVGAPQLSGEVLMRNLIDGPLACAVKIGSPRSRYELQRELHPLRAEMTADAIQHLRDAFLRAIAGRQKLARDTSTEEDEKVGHAGQNHAEAMQRIASSMQQLKSMMPTASIPKGNSLVLLKSTDGSLVMEYEGKVLGRVDDPWVAREIMLTYFADKEVISEKLKADVARGLEGFAGTKQRVSPSGWDEPPKSMK
ncbi:hypothetical protein P7C73_g6664, partial [Tremellales sp. Uapishka_1]